MKFKNQIKRPKFSQGVTLVELTVYLFLLTSILAVVYQFFIQVNYQRIEEVVREQLYANSRRIIFDLQQNIRKAALISEPAVGVSSQVLNLDNGQIIYNLDNQSLVKTENGQTENITDSQVYFESISFTQLGPSSETPTLEVSFTLKGRHLIEGRELEESFQTAVTLR